MRVQKNYSVRESLNLSSQKIELYEPQNVSKALVKSRIWQTHWIKLVSFFMILTFCLIRNLCIDSLKMIKMSVFFKGIRSFNRQYHQQEKRSITPFYETKKRISEPVILSELWVSICSTNRIQRPNILVWNIDALINIYNREYVGGAGGGA